MNVPVYAAILAAGEGRRLRPFTETCPKPLVPWLDGPMITTAVNAVRSQQPAGIGVNAHHCAEAVAEWARHLPDSVEVVREPGLLGTGGGARSVAHAIGATRQDNAVLIVWNGDIVASPPLLAMLDDVCSGRAIASLALRPLMADERGLNVVSETNDIASLPDHEGEHHYPGNGNKSPDSPDAMHSYTGICVMRADILRDVTPNVELCLFRDILGPELARGHRIAFRMVDGLVADLGTPARFIEGSVEALVEDFEGLVSRKVYRSHEYPNGTLWAHRNVPIPGDLEVRGDVVLGEGARVDPGAALTDCVVLDGRVERTLMNALQIGTMVRSTE